MIDKGLKDLFKSKYFYISLFILFVGIILNQISGNFIVQNVDNLPVLSDLVLDNIPYYRVGFVYDVFNLLCLSIFLLFIINKKKYKQVPYYITLFGILYIIWGIFIILTPFGNPGFGNNDILTRFSEVFGFGMYPSGHTGSSFLAFLLAGGLYKWAILVCSIIVIISLFISKGHYSIDILSALIFAYAVYCFGKQYIKMGQDEK